MGIFSDQTKTTCGAGCLLAAVYDFVVMAVRITTGLLRGKGSVVAVPGADTVGSYNSKMISSVPSQATDVGSNIPEGVSSLTLHSRGAPVIGRGATLEINARGQPMRIE